MDSSSAESDDDYGSNRNVTKAQKIFVKSMAELEAFIKEALIEDCKLDACLEQWEGKSSSAYSLETPAERNAALDLAKEELRTNINRLLPEYLEDPTGADVLSDPKLTQKRAGRHGKTSYYYRDRKSRSNDFNRSLLDVIMPHFCPLDKDQPSIESNVPPLTRLASKEACRQLDESIDGEKAAASFVCGGSLSTISAPVRVFWACDENPAEARQLSLPLGSTSTKESSREMLDQLVADCQPASFGRGQQDVLDPEYRKAGKLDPRRFVSDFSPDDCGIVDLAEQILLPNFNTDLENSLPFRKLKAELYKLNVYSGPSGLFKKHVDTPRSENQIGSLVVCLPSPFQGGKLVVRHQGREVDFDWGSQSASSIQWAAFYSDCEHEIMTVTEGERLTLTYNLFATEFDGGSIPRSVMDPTKIPIWHELKQLISEPAFMTYGGILGIYCSHGYPHAAEHAQELLPRGLKGADLALFSVLKSLGLEVDVRPVLRERKRSFYGGPGRVMTTFLKPGTTLKPKFEQVPKVLPLDEDIDRHWKTLYLSRRVARMESLHRYVPENRREDFDKNNAVMIGAGLNKFHLADFIGTDNSTMEIVNRIWPAQQLPGVTWLGKPKHTEMAFAHAAYGNEPSTDCMYSVAAILAIVPPFAKRQDLIRALN